jgi:arylsulfatase A-like enzyme
MMASLFKSSGHLMAHLSSSNFRILQALLMILCCFYSLALQAQERPNILVLISDDQNMDSIGAYGSDYKTPNIDRLAKEGIVHTRAYTTATLCVPTRYSCLTGSYPSRCQNDIYGPLSRQASIRNGASFCETDRTVAQALRKAGYYTGATGKWHNDLDKKLQNMMKIIPKDADPKKPNVIKALKAIQNELRQRLDTYGFDYAECITDGNLDHFPKALEHHNIEYTVKGAIDFLEQVPKEKPFFLWTAFTATHGPHEAIDSGDLRATPEGYTEKHIKVMPPRETYMDKDGKWRNVVKEMVQWMDGGIGVILEKLEKQGKLDNTLIVFLSDQQNAGKASPYERGANIPFIARWPNHIQSGSSNDTLLDVTDMTATFLDVAKASPIPGMQLDGLSIQPIWKGEKEELKPYILTESGFSKAIITRDWKYIAIRYSQEAYKRGFIAPQQGSLGEHLQKGSFKLLWEKGPFGQPRDNIGGTVSPDQLYHILKDPKEQNNLIHNPEYAEMAQKLKTHLGEKVRSIGRPFGEFN